jgi:hypothetical protein
MECLRDWFSVRGGIPGLVIRRPDRACFASHRLDDGSDVVHLRTLRGASWSIVRRAAQ